MGNRSLILRFRDWAWHWAWHEAWHEAPQYILYIYNAKHHTPSHQIGHFFELEVPKNWIPMQFCKANSSRILILTAEKEKIHFSKISISWSIFWLQGSAGVTQRDRAWHSVTPPKTHFLTKLVIFLSCQCSQKGYRCSFGRQIHPAYSFWHPKKSNCIFQNFRFVGGGKAGRPVARNTKS